MTAPSVAMLFFDVTKVAGHSHRSGIVRVSQQLRHELARTARQGVTEVAWSNRLGTFVGATTGVAVVPLHSDWLLTPELFSENERPGLTEWLLRRPCRTAALYHDSIPLQYPEFTWPHSVSRHPHYLKMLSFFDLVIAVSNASAREVWSYWDWLGVRTPEVVSVVLGADGANRQRNLSPDPRHAERRAVAMIGIVEPRKNQGAVLDAAEALWAENLGFSLVFAGRVNPHFGRPIAARIRALQRAGLPVRHATDLDDRGIAALLASARFTVLPSFAEGCGLPVLESLWAGVPAVCAAIPALVEIAAAGGCRLVPPGDTNALTQAMRELLIDDGLITRLAAEACASKLTTWADTARAVLSALGD